MATYSLCSKRDTMYIFQPDSRVQKNKMFDQFSVFFALVSFRYACKNSVSLQSETSENNLLFRYFASLIFTSVLLRFASERKEGTPYSHRLHPSRPASLLVMPPFCPALLLSTSLLSFGVNYSSLKINLQSRIDLILHPSMFCSSNCSKKCCGAGTFWLEPVYMSKSGSSSNLDEKEQILNFLRSNIDFKQIKTLTSK